jgi:hypothetical protein
MVSSTGSIVVPLSAAYITTANVQDNPVYDALTSIIVDYHLQS